MPNTTARTGGLVAQVVEVALGYNPKRADGGEYPGIGAVYLVYAVALSHRLTIATSRQVQILREDIWRIAIFRRGAIARAATTTQASVPRVAAISLIS